MSEFEQSRMHRLMVGDKVEYVDPTTWPAEKLEGEIVAFANTELSYVEVKFSDEDSRVLTEDEVKRVS